MAVQNFTTEELESEEWRAVVAYEGRYSVSSIGRIKSGSVLLKPRLNDSGYLRVNLSNGTRRTLRTFCVHQLVARAFLGTRPTGYVTNHKNGEKTDNRVNNLEYITSGDNTRHAYSLGLIAVPRPKREARSLEHSEIIKRLRQCGVSRAIISHAFQLSLQQVTKLTTKSA